jgi:hypothetical protein
VTIIALSHPLTLQRITIMPSGAFYRFLLAAKTGKILLSYMVVSKAVLPSDFGGCAMCPYVSMQFLVVNCGQILMTQDRPIFVPTFGFG